ncbi:intradiol ring-cleavage dioxygenase [Arthrobacter sp. NPDC055585]
MPHNPESTVYQGRPLPRPEEDLEDQGLAFDVGTLLQRRQLLKAFGVGGLTLALAACGAASEAGGGEIPDETAGPYPGDGSNGPDVLEQSGIVRSDIRSSFGESSGTAEGIPMVLELRITDLANGGAPFAGVAVYVWHCTREGLYSMYSEGVEDQNYLRGVQIADVDGVVQFSSVFPACYSGRWPHIHFEVHPDEASITDSANAIATSQVALPEDACKAVYAIPGYEASVRNLAEVTLQSDNVFGDDGGASQLGAVTGSVEQGYSVSLTAAVDTRTEPGAGMDGPAGGGAPGAGTGGPGGTGGPDGGMGAPGGEPPAGGVPGGDAPAGRPPAAP